MNWRTVLVPHDYSTCADRALRLAADLARHHGARIVLAHVTQLAPGITADALIADKETGEMIRVDQYASKSAVRELDMRAGSLRQDGVVVEVVTATGDVVDRILELAVEEKADLVVMGTNGRTGLAHVFLGSVAEKVLRQSPIPVLTVRDVPPDGRRTTSEMVLPDLATD
jgi:nucleotide-binding universal stress UspA family protein